MSFANPSDAEIAALLRRARTIALIGASPNPARDSHQVMAFLQARGHRVIPINPGQAGKTLLGETVYATLADVPQPIDMADVFRASEHLDGVVNECIAVKVPAIWAQLGVWDEHAQTPSCAQIAYQSIK
jgi:uncharacterized protein